MPKTSFPFFSPSFFQRPNVSGLSPSRVSAFPDQDKEDTQHLPRFLTVGRG